MPGTEWGADLDTREAIRAAPFEAKWRALPGGVQQAFTHFLLQLRVYAAPVANPRGVSENCFWLGPDEIAGAGFSSIMRKALAHAMNEMALAA